MTKEYRVTWEISLDAESPTEAAESALEIQRDPESTALVFEVLDTEADVTFTVDLKEVESSPADVLRNLLNAIQPDKDGGWFICEEAESAVKAAREFLGNRRFKVGDKVVWVLDENILHVNIPTYVRDTGLKSLNGVVEEICANEAYPVAVNFPESGLSYTFSAVGKYSNTDPGPSLHHLT